MKWLALLLIFIPYISLADTFLCVAEVGALVEDGAGKPASAHLANVSARKFLLTQGAGSWGVKALGEDYFLFDQCTELPKGEAPYFCESSSGYAGAFARSSNGGAFSITWISMNDDRREQWVVAKGRCSKL